jgi:quercetin dioxygenase-like cupin family protein
VSTTPASGAGWRVGIALFVLPPATKHTVENLGAGKLDLILVELKNPPAAGAGVAKDAVKLDPKHYKVAAEGDGARVLRINYGADEKSVMHDHPATVVVALTDGEFRFTSPKPGEAARPPVIKAGFVGWAEAETHLPESVGGAPFEAILIELKTKAPKKAS